MPVNARAAAPPTRLSMTATILSAARRKAQRSAKKLTTPKTTTTTNATASQRRSASIISELRYSQSELGDLKSSHSPCGEHHVRVGQGQLCDLAIFAGERDLGGRNPRWEEHEVASVHQQSS